MKTNYFSISESDILTSRIDENTCEFLKTEGSIFCSVDFEQSYCNAGLIESENMCNVLVGDANYLYEKTTYGEDAIKKAIIFANNHLNNRYLD